LNYGDGSFGLTTVDLLRPAVQSGGA